jgi:hypothetical protein
VPQAKKPHWKLGNTLRQNEEFKLKRKLEYRPIEDEDVRYAWAAYKMGALKSAFEDGLTPEAFKTEFVQFILSRYDAAWVLFAETRNGFIPAGLALGFWPHAAVSHFLIFNNFVWFPWATPRNRIESSVNFFKWIRHDIPMIGFARPRDKKFCEVLAQHGLLAKVGTTFNVFPSEKAAVWETRNGRSAERA